MTPTNSAEALPELKKVFVVWTNTDLTEGRGSPMPIAVCQIEATARRVAKGAGVQGTNADVRPFDAILHANHWCAPVSFSAPIPQDLEAQRRLDAQAAAVAKAMAAGLSDDDIRALRNA